MMKRVTLLTALVSACLLAVAFAATQGSAAHYTSGIVLAVNGQTHRIAIKEAGLAAGETVKATLEFVVEPGSQITKNGQPIELTSIKTGDPVTIEYMISGNQNLTRTIQVLTSPTR